MADQTSPISAQTVVQAISAGVTLIPEGAQLVAELQALMSAPDKASIDAALSALDAQADAAHASAQSL